MLIAFILIALPPQGEALQIGRRFSGIGATEVRLDLLKLGEVQSAIRLESGDEGCACLIDLIRLQPS